MTVLIRDILENVVNKELGIPRAFDEYKVFSAWAKSDLDSIKIKASPDRFFNGVLFLKVKDSAWAQQITMLRPQIISNINRVLGQTLVNDLKVRTGQRDEPEQKESKKRERTCPECSAIHRGSNDTCEVCLRKNKQELELKLCKLIDKNPKLTFSLALKQMPGIKETDYRRAKREILARIADKKRFERRNNGREKISSRW